MDKKEYDIIVVGSGPAGLTAAIYARRAGKTVLVLEKEAFGGQITHSPKVENYPAIPDISGLDLGNRMAEQAMDQGADVEIEEVIRVEARDGRKIIRCILQMNICPFISCKKGCCLLAEGVHCRDEECIPVFFCCFRIKCDCMHWVFTLQI